MNQAPFPQGTKVRTAAATGDGVRVGTELIVEDLVNSFEGATTRCSTGVAAQMALTTCRRSQAT